MKIHFINDKPDLSFFTKRGLNIEASYSTCDEVFKTIPTSKAITPDNKTVQIYSPDVFDYLSTIKEKYDVIVFGWYAKDYSSQYAYSGGQTFGKLPNGAYYITVRIDGANYTPHEIMHAIGYILYRDLKKYDVVDQMDSIVKPDGTVLRYYKNDTPEDPDSNFCRTWETYKKYLPELNNLNKMPTYKYFSPKEIVGLKPELVEKLDKARGIAGFPFVIVSGFRTAEHNAEVGGVENSAHTLGEAVDLSCPDSSKRWKMLNALLQVGFNRLGINKTTIHADISKTLPQNVVWTYYK